MTDYFDFAQFSYLTLKQVFFCKSLATEIYEHIGNDLLLIRLQIDRENVNHKYDNHKDVNVINIEYVKRL